MKKIESLDDLTGYTGLVVFSAVWCAPCKRFKPALEAHCAGAGVELREIDVGAQRDLAMKFGVRGVPTTMNFVNGEPGAHVAGETSMTIVAKLHEPV